MKSEMSLQAHQPDITNLHNYHNSQHSRNFEVIPV